MVENSDKCPYSFIDIHEDWSAWHVDVLYNNLSDSQAAVNSAFRRDGWRLVDGMKYGGWWWPSAYIGVSGG